MKGCDSVLQTRLTERSQKTKALLYALLLNTVVLIAALAFSTMRFGTNDDRDISNLLANVYGCEGGYYINFINVFFCRFMAFVYRITNNLTNWYVLFSVGLSFVSLTLISYLLILRAERVWQGICLAVILVARLYRWHYVIFQFTQNSVLFAMAGVLLLIDGLLHSEKSILRYIFGVFLVVVGCMLRMASMYFTLPYLAMYIVYELIFTKKPNGFFPWLSKHVKPFIALAVCLALIYGIQVGDRLAYKSDPDLSLYLVDNDLRGELLDYGFPSYEENAEELTAIGISQEDMDLMASQCYLDRSVYSHDALRTMVDLKETQALTYSVENLDISSLKTVMASIVQNMTGSLHWWSIFALCLCGLAVIKDKKRILLYLGSLCLAVVMMWYFLSVNRMPARVLYAITAPQIISILYLLGTNIQSDQYKPRFLKRNGNGEDDAAGMPQKPGTLQIVNRVASVLLVAAAVGSAALMVYHIALGDRAERSDTYELVIEFAEAHPDQLVLIDRPSITEYTYVSTVTPMTTFAAGSHQNVCYQGGWICWTPGNLSTLERFGTTNVYQSIADGMEVYMIDQYHAEAILAFIHQHYSENVQMELTGYIEGTEIRIYRLFV